MQNIISLDTEKLPEGASSMTGQRPPPPHTHTGGTLGGGAGPSAPRGPTPMNLSKHLLTYWLGVSTVELCGWKKRDLGGILRYVRAQKWGGGDLLLPPPPWKVGGRAPPLPPPCSYAYVLRCRWTVEESERDGSMADTDTGTGMAHSRPTNNCYNNC